MTEAVRAAACRARPITEAIPPEKAARFWLTLILWLAFVLRAYVVFPRPASSIGMRSFR
jgi:hypothetical protein